MMERKQNLMSEAPEDLRKYILRKFGLGREDLWRGDCTCCKKKKQVLEEMLQEMRRAEVEEG